MAYLLDTDWAIEAISGNVDLLNQLQMLAGGQISISWVTIAELFDGAYRSNNPSARLARIEQFTHRYPVLYPNDYVAMEFAALRVDLRRRGNLIEDFDLVIAATALHYDLTLLTFNRRHFERIPDLRLYSRR
jgi:predicted nucleic acid-binding protein